MHTPARRPATPYASRHEFVEVSLSATTGDPALRGTPACQFGYHAGGHPMSAGWRWQDGLLEVFTDRYAVLPLYWSLDAGVLRVSTSVPRLLHEGARRELDDDALSVFVRTGSFIGNDTPYRAIRALPPGGSLRWQNGRVAEAGVRPVSRAAPALSLDEVIDGYFALFREAMSAAPWDSVRSALPLSGGKDSRHILLELHASSRLPGQALTFEQLPWQESNLDVPIAAELARRTGVPHVLLAQTGDPLRNEIEKNLLTDLCSDEHAHAMALVRTLAGSGSIIYDGLAGDVLSESKVRDPSWSEALREGRIREVAERELGPGGYVNRVLVDELARRWSRERALAHLEHELGQHCAAPNPFGSYRFWNRARREVALSPLGMLADGNVVCLPYLYPPLYDFLSSLPSSLLTRERIHTSAIRRGYPAFADIPFDHERRLPTATAYQPTRSVGTARRARLHSARWIAAAARYGLQRSKWLKTGYTGLLAARSIVQPGHASLPWLPRMLVLLGMLERIERRDGALERLIAAHVSSSARAGEVPSGGGLQ